MQDNKRLFGASGFTHLEGNDMLGLNLISRVSVGDIATRAADAYGSRPAIIEGSRSISFDAFDKLANRIGSGLVSLGLSKGDVVGVMSRNCTEALACYFACAKAGLVFCPINLGLRTEEIHYCLHDAKARVLIAQRRFGTQAVELSRDVGTIGHFYWIENVLGPDSTLAESTLHDLATRGDEKELEVLVEDRDPVQLLYTSGTTSRPKGVLTSHLAVTMTALSSALANRMTPESTTLMTLPLYHCALLNGRAVPAMSVGATAVLTDGFQEVETADLIEHHKITTLVLLPMMYQGLLSHPETAQRRFPTVSRACYAMTPMPEERLKAIRQMFPNADVVLGAGQTEFTPPATYQHPAHQWEKASSWGAPTPMTRAAIMGDSGNLLPRGEIGEIVYRGPQVMTEYLNNPEQTMQSFKGDWFHSGDMGWIDDEGVIWFADRKKDVIKSGGENVASIEVERCLMEHPAVSEAAVIGLPHPRWGEAVTAAVVLKGDLSVDEQELIAHCKLSLSSFKAPKSIQFVDDFPRTGTGKIKKHEIRQSLGALYHTPE